MVDRFIRTLKEQYVHRYRFETIQHAMRDIGDWIAFYNNRRPHQALAMRTPVKAFRLAAEPEQIPLGQYTAVQCCTGNGGSRLLPQIKARNHHCTEGMPG